MHKIICSLILFINFNLLATNGEQKYQTFVQEMMELPPDSLLKWFVNVPFTSTALETVLKKDSPGNLSKEEKASYDHIIETLVRGKKIDDILRFFENQQKIKNLDKNEKDYAENLIKNVLENIPSYLQNIIVTFHNELNSNEKKQLIIEFFDLEKEYKNKNKENYFLTTEKDILIGFLKSKSFMTATADENEPRSLSHLENEYVLLTGSPIVKKAALLSFSLVSRCSRLAEGNSEELKSAVSHVKYLIEHADKIKTLKDIKYPFVKLALSIRDKSNLLDGEIRKELIMPVIYLYVVSKMPSDPLLKLLIKKHSFILASRASAELENIVREVAISSPDARERLVEIISINEDESLKNVKIRVSDNQIFIDAIYQKGDKEEEVSLKRSLYLFGNKFKIPPYWNSVQTNLFCSKVVSLSDEILPSIKKEFNPGGNTFNDKIEYIKILQHILNYDNFINRYPEHHRIGYYGSGSIVPRTIVLNSNKYSFPLCDPLEVENYYMINTNFYSPKIKAYKCKNTSKNSQILIVKMGYTKELLLSELILFTQNKEALKKLCFNEDRFDKETVLKNLPSIFEYLRSMELRYDMLSVPEEDGSTSYYCIHHAQLYCEYLIEYNLPPSNQ